VRPEGLCQRKIQMTPLGIEPATFLACNYNLFMGYSAALSGPSHVFSFFFRGGTTKIIFRNQGTPPLLITFTGQKRFIAGHGTV